MCQYMTASLFWISLKYAVFKPANILTCDPGQQNLSLRYIFGNNQKCVVRVKIDDDDDK